MPARRALPDTDHIARFVSDNKIQRDPDTNDFLGITAAAFAIRPDDEGGLSTTWVEYFGPKSVDALRAVAAAYRESLPSKKIGLKSIFALASVKEVKKTALDYNKKLRIVHDPVDGNSGHAEIRHFDDDDLELLERFANETFSEIFWVKDLNVPPREN